MEEKTNYGLMVFRSIKTPSDFFHLFGNSTHTGSIGKNCIVFPPIGKNSTFKLIRKHRLEMSWTNTKSNKDHDIKCKLAIGCFSWCKCFYMMSNFEDWENIIHFGNFFCSIGKKTYFLALGTNPVKGVGFIAGKITDT